MSRYHQSLSSEQHKYIQHFTFGHNQYPIYARPVRPRYDSQEYLRRNIHGRHIQENKNPNIQQTVQRSNSLQKYEQISNMSRKSQSTEHSLRGIRKNQNQEKKQIQNEYFNQQKLNQQLQQRSRDTHSEQLKYYINKIEQLQKENLELKEQVKQQNIKSLMQQIEILKDKLNFKQTTIILLNKKVAQIENKNSELEMQLSYNQKQMLMDDSRIKQLKQQKQMYLKELIDQKQKNENMNTLYKKKDSLKQLNQDLENRIQHAKEQNKYLENLTISNESENDITSQFTKNNFFVNEFHQKNKQNQEKQGSLVELGKQSIYNDEYGTQHILSDTESMINLNELKSNYNQFYLQQNFL